MVFSGYLDLKLVQSNNIWPKVNVDNEMIWLPPTMD